MPMAPSPYGIYTAPPPPPTAMGLPHVGAAYPPYIGPPPPTTGGTLSIPSPLQGPHQPPNGFYATTPNGIEPIETNGVADGGMHYQCIGYPPPVSFFYSPNTTNIGGGGGTSNTPPNSHQSGVAGPLPSAVCQQVMIYILVYNFVDGD